MNVIFDTNKPIAIGCDHAGFEYKEAIKQWLADKGLTIKDFGTSTKDSVDYPDFAHPVASFVEGGAAAFGILLCGTANGVAITANKHPGIRAALCWQTAVADLVRRHNDANVICIPARFVELPQVLEMLEAFMHTAFEGGRHEKRVHKMVCM